MAQPLENRITAALRSSSRIKDVESTISDVGTEIGATQIKFDHEQARSIDPALTTPQAREARNNAADLEHDIRRLNASLDLLKVRRQTILDDESYAKRVARYEAAKAERNDLARHIRTRYPAIGLELAELAKRIAASDVECEAASRDRPRDEPVLQSAEHLARECGYYWEMQKGGSPVVRIGDIMFPLLGRDGTYMPTGFWNGERLADGIAADQEMAKRPIPGIPEMSASESAASKLGAEIAAAGNVIAKRNAANA